MDKETNFFDSTNNSFFELERQQVNQSFSEELREAVESFQDAIALSRQDVLAEFLLAQLKSEVLHPSDLLEAVTTALHRYSPELKTAVKQLEQISEGLKDAG